MSKKIAAALLAVVIVAAAVAAVLVVSAENDYETYTTLPYTADERLAVEGVLLCEQVAVTVPNTGPAQYMLNDGERVAKGGEIARVYQNSSAVDAARRISLLQNELDDLATVQKQAAAETLSPQSLAGQLSALYGELNSAAAGGDTEQFAELRRRLTRLLNYKNTNSAEGQPDVYSQRMAEIRAEITALKGTMGSFTTVTAQRSGFFYRNGAGHVAVTKNQLRTLTCDQVDAYIAQGQAAAQSSSPMLVTGYTYNFIFNLPSIQAALLPSGSLQMIFPQSGEHVVTASIETSNKQGGENSRTAMAVSIISGSDNILGSGVFSAEILLSRQTGLRVPRKAIRTAEADGAEVSGVYVMVGPVMEFRRINVLLADGDYAVCEQTGKKGWLAIYDKIVVSGKQLSDKKIIS